MARHLFHQPAASTAPTEPHVKTRHTRMRNLSPAHQSGSIAAKQENNVMTVPSMLKALDSLTLLLLFVFSEDKGFAND